MSDTGLSDKVVSSIKNENLREHIDRVGKRLVE